MTTTPTAEIRQAVLPHRLITEHIARVAAECTLYHIPPTCKENIPIFNRGARIFFLEGHEDKGIIYHASQDFTANNAIHFNNSKSNKPCLVPQSIFTKAGISVEEVNLIAPHIVKIPIFAVLDYRGFMNYSGRNPLLSVNPETSVYLFPYGIEHSISADRLEAHAERPQLLIRGLFENRTARLTSRLQTATGEQPVEQKKRGVPTLSQSYKTINFTWD